MRLRLKTFLLIGAFILTAMFSTSANAQSQLPFSNISVDRPTLSPYLQLLNTGNPSVSNYAAFVRPILDQQNANRSQQEQIRSLQSTQQQLLRAPQGVSAQGSREIRSTGHETVYMNRSHFFPQELRR